MLPTSNDRADMATPKMALTLLQAHWLAPALGGRGGFANSMQSAELSECAHLAEVAHKEHLSSLRTFAKLALQLLRIKGFP